MENLKSPEAGNKNEKIDSFKIMERIGLPLLPYLVLDHKNFRQQINEFMQENKIDKIMIRTDGKGRGSPSCLNAIPSDELFQKIDNYFLNGYSVFVSHPGNTYRNLHSLNIGFLNGEINIKVIGPGFIATDLNQKNMIPHETFSINPEDLSVTDRKINSVNYEKDVSERIKVFFWSTKNIHRCTLAK